MVSLSDIIKPKRIPTPTTKRVNVHNVRWLTGVGRDTVDAVEFAVNLLSAELPDTSHGDESDSLGVWIYPRGSLASERDLSLLQRDIAATLSADPMIRVRALGATGALFHLMSDGSPVSLVAHKINGGTPTLTICHVLPMGDRGPCYELKVVPLDYVVDQPHDLTSEYVVYLHTLSPPVIIDTGYGEKGMNYVGITKQGWRKRFQQHLTAARSGSPLLFHKALRDNYVLAKVCQHRVLTVCADERAAMDIEEEYVEGTNDPEIVGRFHGMETSVTGTLYPKGLNMIPGGYAGIKFLHRLGALKENAPVDVDRREDSLIPILDRKSRDGVANPLLAARWMDEDYAARIICGPEGRLKLPQIAQARTLDLLGYNSEEITKMVGAKNYDQISRLLKGKTYSRIK